MAPATNRKTVEYLVVAPHPDDAELAMGGTIIKLLEVLRNDRCVVDIDAYSGNDQRLLGTRYCFNKNS